MYRMVQENITSAIATIDQLQDSEDRMYKYVENYIEQTEYQMRKLRNILCALVPINIVLICTTLVMSCMIINHVG